MKKIILFTAVLIVGLITFVNAQDPISFRSNALGGIINDDLDLIYDPIELRFVGRKYKPTRNGIYDVGEKFTDLGNNTYDKGESFQDQNENGIYDVGEPFEDLDNGIYDDGEPFEDSLIAPKGKGIRLYTNLSNLTSSEELLFEDISDDELLIGASSRNPLLKFLWHSILVRFQNSETSNMVGIDSNFDGVENITGNGNLEDEYTAFLDTDLNGSYDTKYMFSQEKSNFTTDDSYTYILNNAIKFWKLTLGVKLSMGSVTNTGNTASLNLGEDNNVLSVVNLNNPTFSRSATTYLIEDDFNNLTWSEDGDFNSDIKSTYTKMGASFMLRLGDYELRSDGKISLNQSWSTNINDSYSGQYENFNPEIENYDDNYSQTHSYISNIDQNGDWNTYGGSIRKTFNKKDERKNDGFWQLGVSVMSGSSKYTSSTFSIFSIINTFFDGLDTLDTDYEETIERKISTRDDGTNKASGLTINSRLNIPLRENVHFGIGCTFENNTSNLKTNYIESENDVHEYNFADPDNNDNNYITTETSKLIADKNYEILTSRFVYPIGLEYRIGKKHNLSFRFGATFTHTSQTIDDEMQITDSEPQVTITVFADTTDVTDITVTDNNIYESTSEHTRTTSTSTVFTYGLGYNPMENLQIDLLGFLGTSNNSIFDTSFYRNFRLSFTMKF